MNSDNRCQMDHLLGLACKYKVDFIRIDDDENMYSKSTAFLSQTRVDEIMVSQQSLG